MTPKIKLIPHTETGLLYILNLFIKLGAHNESYYRNTFKYFMGPHPPYPLSYIYYEPHENFFKFAYRKNIDKLPVKTWEAYDEQECMIRINKVAIHNISPHIMIVSGADWLIGNVPIDPVIPWHEYMTKLVAEEMIEWKKLITELEPKTKKLF